MYCCKKHCFVIFQPTPTPKRPNDEDSGDSDEETARAVKMRRIAKAKTDQMMYQLSKGLPKEPVISDKEKEDILRYVETEATEVSCNVGDSAKLSMQHWLKPRMYTRLKLYRRELELYYSVISMAFVFTQ